MASEQLDENYERLKNRGELYRRATRISRALYGLGTIILVLSVIPVIPLILASLFQVEWSTLYYGCSFVGILIALIGAVIKRGRPLPPELSIEEENFLEVIESLRDIKTYLEEDVEFSRLEASKRLTKIERRMSEPSWSSSSLWKAFARESNDEIRLLKSNFKERLIPSISKGKIEDVRKAYPIVGEFASYILRPKVSKLTVINKAMSKLEPFPEEKPVVMPFLDRHANVRHSLFLVAFLGCGVFATYIAINFMHTSNDNAMLAGATIFGALAGPYIGAIVYKKTKG